MQTVSNLQAASTSPPRTYFDIIPSELKMGIMVYILGSSLANENLSEFSYCVYIDGKYKNHKKPSTIICHVCFEPIRQIKTDKIYIVDCTCKLSDIKSYCLSNIYRGDRYGTYLVHRTCLDSCPHDISCGWMRVEIEGLVGFREKNVILKQYVIKANSKT